MFAGVGDSRLCNFSSACNHFDIALRYSIELEDKLGEMATLANICSLLDNIGLINVAKKVAERVASFPSQPGPIDHLHFQNATNALRWCAHTNDFILGKHFMGVAVGARVTAAGHLDELSLAYFDANSVEYLLASGDSNSAQLHLERLLKQEQTSTNFRLSALAAISLARYHIVQDDQVGIARSLSALADLRETLRGCAVQYEEVLCMLVKLTLEVGRELDAKEYSQELREYLIQVKHKEFFISSAGTAAKSIADLVGPVHSIPENLCQLDQEPLEVKNERYEERIKLALFPFLVGEQEMRQFSREYAAVEDWAVAAELLAGHDGSHCFKVGSLVRDLFLLVGDDEPTAKVAEYAARLHDIGKIGLVEIARGRSRKVTMGDWFSTREHALLGYELLSLSEHAVMKVAAQMARHHHEWWNGCGLPDGKRREEIPLVARVCAVANCFVSFVDGEDAWEISAALDQITAMSGVQLDPRIVSALIEFVNSGCVSLGAMTSPIQLESNRLVLSKDALIALMKLRQGEAQ